MTTEQARADRLHWTHAYGGRSIARPSFSTRGAALLHAVQVGSKRPPAKCPVCRHWHLEP